MVRANVRNAMGIYIGLIDEVGDGFRIVWNGNVESEPGKDILPGGTLFPDFESACEGVQRAVTGARISETIYFRPVAGEVH